MVTDMQVHSKFSLVGALVGALCGLILGGFLLVGALLKVNPGERGSATSPGGDNGTGRSGFPPLNQFLNQFSGIPPRAPAKVNPAAFYSSPIVAAQELVARIVAARLKSGDVEGAIRFIDTIPSQPLKDQLRLEVVRVLLGQKTAEAVAVTTDQYVLPPESVGRIPAAQAAPPAMFEAPPAPGVPSDVEPADTLPSPPACQPAMGSDESQDDPDSTSVPPTPAVSPSALTDTEPVDDATLAKALAIATEIRDPDQKVKALGAIATTAAREPVSVKTTARIEELAAGLIPRFFGEAPKNPKLPYLPSPMATAEISDRLVARYLDAESTQETPAQLIGELREAAESNYRGLMKLDGATVEGDELPAANRAEIRSLVENAIAQGRARRDLEQRTEETARRRGSERFWGILQTMILPPLLAALGFVLSGLLTPLIRGYGFLLASRFQPPTAPPATPGSSGG